MTKRRTTISVETQRLSVIRSAASAIEVWCEACGAVVPMFVPERAAEVSHTTPREIYRRVEIGEIHFVETDSGELLICGSSLEALAVASFPSPVGTGARGEGLREEEKEKY